MALPAILLLIWQSSHVIWTIVLWNHLPRPITAHMNIGNFIWPYTCSLFYFKCRPNCTYIFQCHAFDLIGNFNWSLLVSSSFYFFTTEKNFKIHNHVHLLWPLWANWWGCLLCSIKSWDQPVWVIKLYKLLVYIRFSGCGVSGSCRYVVWLVRRRCHSGNCNIMDKLHRL